MSKPWPARSDLPQGQIKCPNCERYNGPDDLVFVQGFGWCCPEPGCTYADPYFNGEGR